MEWMCDVTLAQWVADALSRPDSLPRAQVTAVVPAGFEAYGRVLHPAYRNEDRVSWKTVASWTNCPITPEAAFRDIARTEGVDASDGPQWWTRDPLEGTLDSDYLRKLVEVLERHTTKSEQITFALWDGLGWDSAFRISSAEEESATHDLPDPIPSAVREGPRLRTAGQEYFLFTGALLDSRYFLESKRQTPHMWWPEDRGWFVSTDIDFDSTYVAGSSTLIDDLATSHLEFQRLHPTDPLTSGYP